MSRSLRWSLSLFCLGLLVQPVQANRIQELASQAGELARNGYPSSAIELYQKAIILDSAQPPPRRDAALYFNMALLLLDGSKIEQAEVALKQAITINPNHLKGHFNLGLLYADLGKKEEAKKELGEALALASNNASLAEYILQTIEEREIMDSSPSAAAPKSQASPASNSNIAPPAPTAP
ncbi:tetratricopeptide repeat protein [Candidatus Cyanaurora vandensis]|uniref:tetratricopeptide repeat protein n=1 Tax=Candidatus Cyanaurora vandensis TaxID=2714958 RepID=UPI00257EF114|nr:tetratricopeptide repeat protein [Candidatus Cyanaurora vandensis]